MTYEIERKYKVKGDFTPFVTESRKIIQGYLSSDPERNVRVRIMGDKGYLTIKGIGDESGTTRFEWEKEIPIADAYNLLKLCEPGIIDKVRYMIPERDGLVFEVDVFHGDNEGLIIAEIELPDENHTFQRPDWLGIEVTGQSKYYNSSLMRKPYNTWK